MGQYFASATSVLWHLVVVIDTLNEWNFLHNFVVSLESASLLSGHLAYCRVTLNWLNTGSKIIVYLEFKVIQTRWSNSTASTPTTILRDTPSDDQRIQNTRISRCLVLLDSLREFIISGWWLYSCHIFCMFVRRFEGLSRVGLGS